MRMFFVDEPTNHLDINSLEWLEDYLTSYKGTGGYIHDHYFLDKVAEK